MRTISKIIVHHTGGSQTWTAQGLAEDHRAHWPDQDPPGAAYHHYIWESIEGWVRSDTRAHEHVGWHDRGENEDSLGIAIAGDYTGQAWEDVPAEARALLLELLAGLMSRYHLSVSDVYGHRENEPEGDVTICPGFEPEGMRRALRRHIDAEVARERRVVRRLSGRVADLEGRAARTDHRLGLVAAGLLALEDREEP